MYVEIPDDGSGYYAEIGRLDSKLDRRNKIDYANRPAPEIPKMYNSDTDVEPGYERVAAANDRSQDTDETVNGDAYAGLDQPGNDDGDGDGYSKLSGQEDDCSKLQEKTPNAKEDYLYTEVNKNGRAQSADAKETSDARASPDETKNASSKSDNADDSVNDQDKKRASEPEGIYWADNSELYDSSNALA